MNFWERMKGLVNLFNTMRARINSLEKRIAALEQSINNRWMG